MPDEKNTQGDKAKPSAATAAVSAPAEPVRNLTRESLELTLAARYELEGKSKAEAEKLAKARAFEMIH